MAENGLGQDIDNPLGIGGTELHQWLFPTRTSSFGTAGQLKVRV